MTLAHDRTGDGTPLLMLHGIGHSRRAWDHVGALLAKQHTVYALDLPGHGETPLPAERPLGVHELTDHVERFVTAQGFEEPPAAVGNSLGGAIALELIRRGVVRSAVALSPAGFWSGWERHYAVAVIRSTLALTRLPEAVLGKLIAVRPLRKSLSGFYFAHPENLSLEELLASVRDFAGPGIPAILPATKHYSFTGGSQFGDDRVTVAWGEHDRLLLTRQAKRARRLLPRARHVTLTGCGHVPMSDDPERVAAVVVEQTA